MNSNDFGKDNGTNRKRINWVCFITFGVLSIVVILLTIYLKPSYVKLSQHDFNPWPLFIYVRLIEPLLYLFGTLFLLHATPSIAEFHLRDSIRKILFYISLILTLSYYAIAFLCVFGGEGVYIFWVFTDSIIKMPVIFILLGIGLYFGFMKTDEHEKVTRK